MLIFDRDNWRDHRPWCLATAAATLGALAWSVIHGFRSGRWEWPGGSSPPGLSLGVIGGAIIVFEMLLWPRKNWWRRRRLGRTKLWMTAHIWLGLLALPLLLLHGGFHFHPAASTLAAVLMWLLVLVVGSGIFGLTIQNIVPRLLLERVPDETIHAQIRRVLGQYRDEAERLVVATCVPAPVGDAGDAVRARTTGRIGSPPVFVPLETLRREGRSQGQAADAGSESAHVAGSEPLLAFFREQVEPYLGAESGERLALGSRGRAASLFLALETDLRPEAHPVVERLAELCDRRRQFDLQRRLHRWLYSWLAIHLALSTALLLLMFVHVYLALEHGWPAWIGLRPGPPGS